MAETGALLKSDVFDRIQAQGALVSPSTYNVVIGLVLCWGFLVNWVIVRSLDADALHAVHPAIFLLGYFASCFFGVYLFNSSTDPAVSFLGYNFVVVPFGLVLDMMVGRYDPGLVLKAVQLTASVTALMMLLGTLAPQFFQAIRATLCISLLAMIVVELAQIFVFHSVPAWTDWAVGAIFCGYIGYDWGRANRIPKTLDNAVDSAAAIYMDIVNVFVRILSLLGRKKR